MPIQQEAINPELQKLNQGSAFIELFTIDLTSFGGAMFHFCNHVSKSGGYVTYQGIPYVFLPIQVTEWGSSLTGTSAQPTLSVSNLSKALHASVTNYGDIVGAKVSRIRTYAKFLDDGETPNPNAYLGPDVMYVAQKLTHSRKLIAFKLCSVLDRMGMRLPRRQMLKDANYLGCSFPGIGRTRTG